MIRENLIPHAVLWFTGEAAAEDDDEEYDDEEEDEEDDEDEEVGRVLPKYVTQNNYFLPWWC